MERDFMGLNSKDSVVVKEEFVEGGCQESGFTRNSGPSWPSSNKVSGLPQFMSLKREQDEKPSKNAQSAHPIHDVKMHPLSMMSPFLKAHFMGTNQKCGGGTMNQFPSVNPLAAASVAGTTEKLINSKASGVPAQLTIFYGGTVNVFDGVSPEKAQAIMLLAENTYVRSNMTQPKLHVQAPSSKHPAQPEHALGNQSINTPPCSGLPSPISISSHPIDQSSPNIDDYKVSKTIKPEPPRATPSVRSVAASAIRSSAVPQARKASLARFLEKRKERVMSAAPYNLNYKKGADCRTPDLNDICSSSLSVTKET